MTDKNVNLFKLNNMALSDKEQKELGKEIQVGFGQLYNPTPQWMKYILRTVLYLSAVWTVLAPMLTELPSDTMHAINMWLLRANALLSVTIKFFGWSRPEN